MKAFCLANDIEIKPGSRFDKYIRVLQGVVETTHPDFWVGVQALQDVQEFRLVLDEYSRAQDQQEWRGRIKQALKDAATVAQDNTKNTRGRDTQFELYVATVLSRAGLGPHFDESPDIRFEFNGKEFGAAVKRVKSEAKLGDNVGKASDQIRGSGVPGIVAMDVTKALHKEPRVLVDAGNSAIIASLHFDSLRAFVARNELEVRNAGRSSWVRGIVFVLSTPSNHAGTMSWTLETATMSFALCERHPRRRGEFEAIFKAYSRGLPTDEGGTWIPRA